MVEPEASTSGRKGQKRSRPQGESHSYDKTNPKNRKTEQNALSESNTENANAESSNNNATLINSVSEGARNSSSRKVNQVQKHQMEIDDDVVVGSSKSLIKAIKNKRNRTPTKGKETITPSSIDEQSDNHDRFDDNQEIGHMNSDDEIFHDGVDVRINESDDDYQDENGNTSSVSAESSDDESSNFSGSSGDESESRSESDREQERQNVNSFESVSENVAFRIPKKRHGSSSSSSSSKSFKEKNGRSG